MLHHLLHLKWLVLKVLQINESIWLADGTGKGGFDGAVYYDSKKLTWRQQNECKQACLDDPECEIAHHFFLCNCYLGKKEAVADQSKWKCHWDQMDVMVKLWILY